MTYMTYKVSVPEGSSGPWKIERFTVDKKESDFASLRAMISGSGFGRGGLPPGTYTRLLRGQTIVMSDTPDEIRDHYALFRAAQGEVLLNGLGLGVALNGCLSKVLADDGTSAGREMAVEHLTVIEKSQDVINLVGPYYEDKFGDRLTIIHADALEWRAQKGKRYDVVWHDIWDDICADNLEEMSKLHRKYGRRCEWQASWCRSLCARA